MEYSECNRIADLIFSFYTGEISGEQQEELQRWLKESPENQQLFAYIIDAGRIRDKQHVLALFDQRQAWQKIRRKTVNSGHNVLWKVFRYAAVVILCIGITTYWLFQTFVSDPLPSAFSLQVPLQARAILAYENQEKVALTNDRLSVRDTHIIRQTLPIAEMMTVSVPRGGEFQLILDDGTEVWMNSETELKFPRRFGGDSREVTLVYGEAYFKVMKDPSHPFRVKGNEISLEVLGTEFNLQNYREEACILTTLVNGAVRLSLLTEPLIPGEQAVYDKKMQTATVRKVDTGLYTAWREGRFIFKSAPLETILRQLSRWYDVSFEYETEELKSLPFSGNIRKYEDGNTILDILMSTGRVRFEQKGKLICVKK